jgi:hypothetical protein
MGAASEFLERLYGYPVTTQEVQIALVAAAAAVQVLPNNPNRLAWTIWNLGAGAAQIGPTSGVGPLFGSNIAAAGGMVGVNVRDDGEFPSRELWGVSAVGTTLYVLELVAV